MRIQPDFAGVHLADALHDQVGSGLLQHDAAAAQLHGLHELVLVLGSRQDDDAGALVGLLQRLQGRQAVQVGHAEIEQQHVGIQLLDLLQHLAAVAGLAHHLEVVFQLEELLQPVANNRMVVGQDDPHRGLLLFCALRAVVDGFALQFPYGSLLFSVPIISGSSTPDNSEAHKDWGRDVT